MEKKAETKSKFQILKELWQNPKTHAMVVLGLWLIFIGGLILFLKISSIISMETPSNQLENNIDPLKQFNDMKSYEFNYMSNDLSLNGTVYEDKYLLYLDNQRYYKNKSLYKISNNIENSNEPEILKLNNKMIYSLIKDISPISNEQYDSYLVPLINFIDTYEGITTNDYNLSSYNIVINVYKKDDIINKVVIDLTNYYKYKGANIDNYILTINYYNIDNISDFTKEYDEMIGVK